MISRSPLGLLLRGRHRKVFDIQLQNDVVAEEPASGGTPAVFSDSALWVGI